jgi:hypothetical protein
MKPTRRRSRRAPTRRERKKGWGDQRDGERRNRREMATGKKRRPSPQISSDLRRNRGINWKNAWRRRDMEVSSARKNWRKLDGGVGVSVVVGEAGFAIDERVDYSPSLPCSKSEKDFLILFYFFRQSLLWGGFRQLLYAAAPTI